MPARRRASATPAVPRTRRRESSGFLAPNALFTGLYEWPVAQGSMRTEGGDANTSYYGYNGNGSFLPPRGQCPVAGPQRRGMNKTEPDKNTYLRPVRQQHGPDPGYDYGTHFLTRATRRGLEGYVTRINLDA